MQFKFLVAALFSVSAVMASPANVQQRQDLGDVLTSVAGSVIGDFTSKAASVGDAIESKGGDVLSDVRSLGGEIFSTVTSVGGRAVTVVTQVGGDAITLAESGAGVVVTKFGSEWTVATAAAGAVASDIVNDGSSMSNFHAQQSLLLGAATVVGGTLLGALLAI